MKFSNYPRYIQHHVYREAIDAYIALIRRHPGVLAVYTLGSISAPGLSDIDLIVVVEDDIKTHLTLSPFLNDMDGRLFLHDVFVIYPALMDVFGYILYATNVRPIFQMESFDRPFQSADQVSDALKLIYLIELSRMRLEQLSAISRSGVCDARKFITRVSSVIHSVALSEDLSIVLPDPVIHFNHRMMALKRDWALNKGKSLRDVEALFTESFEIWALILEAAAKTFVTVVSEVGPSRRVPKRGFTMHFSDTDRCRLVRDRNGGVRRVLIPKNLFFHFEGYFRAPERPYQEEQQKRRHYVMAHKRFLRRKFLHHSMTGNIGVPLTLGERLNSMIRTISYQYRTVRRWHSAIRYR